MKIAAIGQRGRKRDFIDLYFLCHQEFTTEDLLRKMPEKFPNITHPSYQLLRGLAYFEDAERDEEPKMLQPVEWEKVRSFFAREANRLLQGL